jgi:hypothetical protein
MSETQTLARDAGPRFDEAVSVAFEDAQQQLLRYHLVRLTVVGLSRDEVPLILDLARQGFADGDVTEQARAILDRPGATELASAIASIVEQSRVGTPFGGRGPVVIGAVIGAYTSIRDAGAGDPAAATTAAVLGAVGGATAAALGRFIQEQVAAVGVTEYLRAAEPSG